MKTWDDLSLHEKERAIKANHKQVVMLVLDGILEMTNPKMQDRIESLIEGSPNVLVAARRIVTDKEVGKEVYALAKLGAEEALYDDDGTQMTIELLKQEVFPTFV